MQLAHGSMIIDDFYFKRIFALPLEAKPPPVVDSDAVLSGPVAPQGFQAVAGRGAQIIQAPGLIQQQQLSAGHPLNRRRQPPGAFVRKQALCFMTSKAAYHVREYNAARYSASTTKWPQAESTLYR
jgi:hypothetical protein